MSVVIAVHNGERFLRAALESVRAQDYRPLQVIVVDDGSDDGTADIAKAFPEAAYLRQESAGVAAARNLGLGAARGAYLAFLDSDDVWAPEKLSEQVRFLDDRPELDFALCNLQFFLEPGIEWPSWFRDKLLEGPQPGWVPSALIVRAGAFERVGAFDPALRVGEDLDWFVRARGAGLKGDLVPKTLVHKRFHGANLTRPTPESKRILLQAVRNAVLQHHRARTETAGPGLEPTGRPGA